MKKSLIFIVIVFLFILTIGIFIPRFDVVPTILGQKHLSILSSVDNKDVESELKDYARKQGISLSITYMGDLDIVEELNMNSSSYDAVWISNSIWLYMLDNSYLTSESKSISISPVVMGIRKSKAQELGLIGKTVLNSELLDLIQTKQIKYVMSSVTQTNTGATAFLGFLNTLAGSPEVLTEEMLEQAGLAEKMISLFSGVERVSGDEAYLETMFLNNDQYEAILSSESSLIRINQELKARGKEELYLLYPKDGVAFNDSTFAFIDHGKNRKKSFLTLQSYLLSKKGQEVLSKLGRRTWYGGVKSDVNKEIFNPDWGIDTTSYLVATKYPSKSVMTKAINLYIEEFRKPTHVVFCLDYSGSMFGDGIDDLIDAMEYILTDEEASKDQLQFSKRDKITVIPFSSSVNAIWQTDNGKETSNLLEKIKGSDPVGSTALYDAIIAGLDILDKESNEYTKTIIAMTDGEVNVGTFSSLKDRYHKLNGEIPIYSITFGYADESQLNEIAKLSNAKVFNGKSGLLKAFKEVRGYN